VGDSENVIPAYFGGKVSKEALLRKLLDDPELDGVAVICRWSDGQLTSGWSDGFSTGSIALGILALQDKILSESSD